MPKAELEEYMPHQLDIDNLSTDQLKHFNKFCKFAPRKTYLKEEMRDEEGHLILGQWSIISIE